MRKLAAVLACRNTGSRLYGKPLQNLDIKNGITILDHLLTLLKSISDIQEIVLGVSEGIENTIFTEIAERNNVKFVVGNERDVLSRLIAGAKSVSASDVFRITTESPFPYFQMINAAYRLHIQNENDATFYMKNLPDGSGFEIITLEALERSHKLGSDKHRSELCTLFIRENVKSFKIDDIEPLSELQRSDLRLTVDYPEDLIVCREIYANFEKIRPFYDLKDIINFLDNRKDLKNIIKRIS